MPKKIEKNDTERSSKPILPNENIGSGLVNALYWCPKCSVLRGLSRGHVSESSRLPRSARCTACHGEVKIRHLEIPMTAADFEAVSSRINGQEVNHAA